MCNNRKWISLNIIYNNRLNAVVDTTAPLTHRSCLS